MEGAPVADDIRQEVRERVRALGERGVEPTLGTLLASDDPADRRFVELKHEACEAVGIASRDVRLDPDAPAADFHAAVEELSDDPDVDGVFVQAPFPQGVDEFEVRRRVDPAKDVDCFHPTNLGRLVAGDPRFLPATPAAVLELLAAYDVETEGRDVVVVGRSSVIGRPLANLLVQKRSPGDATVTVCHSRTPDLGAVTRRGDVVVTACGVPELVDGSMLAPGAVVVDVSANRRARGEGDGSEVVGDVNFESAGERASLVTPVPGGVGPVTLATLLRNVVLAAEGRSGAGDAPE